MWKTISPTRSGRIVTSRVTHRTSKLTVAGYRRRGARAVTVGDMDVLLAGYRSAGRHRARSAGRGQGEGLEVPWS
jgi:hypothetical protein